jgi:hypothetical protein
LTVAQLTRPRIVFISRGNVATPRIAVRVVLEDIGEIAAAARGGSLSVICELHEWDRTGAWIHRPLHVYQEAVLQGRDFEGGVVHEVIFREAFPLNDLREDLLGRDEIVAVTWLFDLSGRRRREIDRTQSDVLRLPRR